MKKEHITVTCFATSPPIDPLKLTRFVYFYLQISAFKISILTVTDHKQCTLPLTVTFLHTQNVII